MDRLAILLALAYTSALTGCGGRATFDDVGVSVDIPQGWRLEASVLRQEGGIAFHAHMRVHSYDRDTTAAEMLFAERQPEDHSYAMSPVRREGTISVGERRIRWVHLGTEKRRDPDGFMYQADLIDWPSVVYLVPEGHHVPFVLHFSGYLPQKHHKLKPKFDEIVQSLRFE